MNKSVKKSKIKYFLKGCLYPIIVYKRYKMKINNIYLENIKLIVDEIALSNNILFFYNNNYFNNLNFEDNSLCKKIECGELLRKKDIRKIGKMILKSNISQVIFSSLYNGWDKLGFYLKKNNPKIKIKVILYETNSRLTEPFYLNLNSIIVSMVRNDTIDFLATTKKSMLPFYSYLGCKSVLLNYSLDLSLSTNDIQSSNKTIIGIYNIASDDWYGNMFTLLAAASLVPNVIVDMVPINEMAKKFAKELGLELTGVNTKISKDELLQRMYANSLNLYVTFSDFDSLFPLESFEVGVPCLIGTANRCFDNSKLEDYIVVHNEESPSNIANDIKKIIENREKILNYYKKWKKHNKYSSANALKSFIKM